MTSTLLLILYLILVVMLLLDLSSLSRKEEEIRKVKNYNPKTLIIVPCKGTDLTLYENLASLKKQNYRNYNIIAVIDSTDDKALPAIKRAKIKYIISKSDCINCSGKVRAVLTAFESFRNYGVYVIADSDITVDNMWLGRLVDPLSSKYIGLSTMFPYFNPVAGFWSKVKLVWGFVGEGLMAKHTTRFGWGGSLAFRRDLINVSDLNFIKTSKYSISDDVSLTKIAKRKGLEIAYTKKSQPKVNSDDNYKKFIEWANRQTTLSVLGYRKNFYLGVVFYSAEIVLLLSGIFLTIFIGIIFIFLLIHLLLAEIKTYRRAGRGDPTIALIVIFMPFLYLSNLIIASRKKAITWRGREYFLRR